MVKATAEWRAAPGKFDRCVQVLLAWSHSQRSGRSTEYMPSAMYPLKPMENPQAPQRLFAGKDVFCVQVRADGSYSQRSLMLAVPRYPVEIYPLLPMEKEAA